MQDRYSGDVGDFGKFGILRHLVNDTNYHLGVNWYLFPNEGHNEDGRFTGYLSGRSFKKCDEELHTILKSVVSNTRCVSFLEKSNIFRCKTTFFSEIVDFYEAYPDATAEHKARRLSLRREWQDKAISTLSDSNVLFIDPDNGLEVKSCGKLSQKKSGKYAFFDEIRRFHQGKEFTVVYHHLNRHKKHGTHLEQIENRAQELKDKVCSQHIIFCVRYAPYSPRVFFIITAPSAVDYIDRKLKSFLCSYWGKYWDNYYVV